MTRFAPAVSDASLSTTVVLHIRSGSFADGFKVTVRILEDNKIVHEDPSFKLPPAPEMRAIYTQWRSQLSEGSRRRQSRLSPVAAQATNVSDADHLSAWRSATKALREYCRQWFGDREFSLIKKDIVGNTRSSQDSSIPIVIRCEENTERDILCRLPYQLWNLHTELPTCEFALFNQPRRPGKPLGNQIKVLAIFGSEAGGLNLKQDDAALRQLENYGAQITKVSEPSNGELDTLLSDYVWDILFFAGHSSSTCEGGRIQIRKDESLSLENLRPSLVYTLSKGLKLAIFNSCDGLGIADFLSQLGVPNIIVMKEPVPDDIAGLFLTEFLKEFTRGTHLCQAIRRARRRISLDQETFPAASWLPVAYLNPNAPELALPKPKPIAATVMPGGDTLIPTEEPTAAEDPTFPQKQRSTYQQSVEISAPLPLPPAQSSSGSSSSSPGNKLTSPARKVSWRFIAPPLALAAFLWVALAAVYLRRCQLLPNAFPACSNALAVYVSEGDHPVEGSNILLSPQDASLKQDGIDAYANGDYAEALRIFIALRESPDAQKDPESLIYQNNARARDNLANGNGSPLYKIAIAAPLDTNSGLDIARGVAQAQAEWINKGLNLVVLIANDQNQTEQARELARQLSSEKDILAVVGHYTSPNTCEALKVYSPNKLPVISPTSTMVNFRSRCGDSNQMFFRTVSSTSKEAFALVKHLTTQLKVQRPNVVAFYNSQELFSTDLFDQLRENVELEGGTVTAFDLSAPNFDTQKLPDEVADADAIAVLPDGGTGGRAALAKAVDIINLNNGNKPVLAANTLYLSEVIDQAGPALVGKAFMAVDWHKDMCEAQDFAAQIRDYWGGDLNRRTALAYEATQVLGYVLDTTSGAKVNRAYIQERLASLSATQAPESDALTGAKISFSNGNRVEITTREIVTLSEGRRLVLATEIDCSK
ncbi:MAG: ABC transporter substrate-binding protein [Phormidesmis sp.]